MFSRDVQIHAVKQLSDFLNCIIFAALKAHLKFEMKELNIKCSLYEF